MGSQQCVAERKSDGPTDTSEVRHAVAVQQQSPNVSVEISRTEVVDESKLNESIFVKKVESQTGDEMESEELTDLNLNIDDEPVKIHEIPYLKSVICVHELNEANKKTHFLLVSPGERSPGHDRRNAISSQKNILSIKDMLNRDEVSYRSDRSNCRLKTLKCLPVLEKAKIEEAKPSTEREAQLIRSTLESSISVQLEKIQFENGSSYEGGWLNGKKSGKGILTWFDGSRYEGMFKGGMANGWGVLKNSEGEVYEGQWSNDEAHGFGKYTLANGSTYAGEWRHDKKHGFGTERFYDGTQYEGDYRRGCFEGKGVLRFPNGNYYEGEFTDGKIHGAGKFVWLKQKEYNGCWDKGQLSGQGVMKWKDGSKYIGEYREDRKNGHGMFWWKNGCSYEGQWVEGLQHGQGTFTNQAGKTFPCYWRHGHLDKFNIDRISSR